MAKYINSITIIITLKRIEKINTEKMTTKHSEEYFFFAVNKRQQTLKWLLEFHWLLRSNDYLTLTFYWFISAG